METDFRRNPESGDSFIRNVPSALLELSADLHTLYERHFNSDVTISLPCGASIPCHRAILSSRSEWFAKRNNCFQPKLRSKLDISIEENLKMMEALLLYMYTGNLCLIESLKVPLFDLYRVAKGFKVVRLIELLKRIVNFEVRTLIKECFPFTYKLYVNDIKSDDWKSDDFNGKPKHCTLLDVTLDGTDKWYLTIRPIKRGEEKHIGIYIIRVSTNLNAKVAHNVKLEMNVIDRYRKERLIFNEFCFWKDNESKLGAIVSVSNLTQCNALPNGVLSLLCKLTISLADSELEPVFKIKPEFRRDAANEFHALSYDMKKLLTAGKFCDVRIQLEGKVLSVHSSILYARTLIPTVLYGKLMDIGRFGGIIWKSFIDYLYTGQSRYVEDHMLEVYYAVYMQQLSKMQKMYSRILANHLTVCNVYNILIDARAVGDTVLIQKALSLMA